MLWGMDATAMGILAVRAFVVVTMASFGLRIASGQLAAVLRRPRLVAGVLAVNLVLLPIVAVTLSIALDLPHAIAVGFVVTACAAGSTYSTKLVELAGGDIGVGVGLMFLLAVVTAVALGPVAAVMVGLLGSATGAQVTLDPVPILATLLLFQVAPILALLGLQQHAPGVAARLRVPAIRASTVLLVLACLAVLADSADELLTLGPVPVLAMVALIATGLAIGFLIGGEGPSHRRATALITGQRSASIAYIAVQGVGLPLATATVVAFAFVMLAVNLGIALTARRLGAARSERGLAGASPAPG